MTDLYGTIDLSFSNDELEVGKFPKYSSEHSVFHFRFLVEMLVRVPPHIFSGAVL